MSELQEIYKNWGQELAYRGTDMIKREKSLDKGYGVKCPDYWDLKNSVNIGKNFIIEFDAFFVVDISISGLFVGTDNLIGIDESTLYLNLSSGSYLHSIETLVGFHKIKILLVNNTSYLFIDNTFINSVSVISGYTDYIFDQLILNTNSSTISNIKLTKIGEDILNDAASAPTLIKEDIYEWKCNEGVGFILNCSKGSLYTAYLSGHYDYDQVWTNNDLFNNRDSFDYNGELRRLISNNVFDEFIFELISNSEQGLCFGISSIMSEEANCINLNKAYEKGDVAYLNKYPIYVETDIKNRLFLNNGYIEFVADSTTNDYIGINSKLSINPDWKTNDIYAPVGVVPFIPIPIARWDNAADRFKGYEISFVINSDNNIDLFFGIQPYDENLDVIDISAGLVMNYINSDESFTFLNETNFSLCKGRDLFIRAVLSVNTTYVGDKLNIGYGDNLYYLDENHVIKFIVPIISFKETNPLDGSIRIKDITMRPLDLETEKGCLNSKNNIFSFLKNNSIRNNTDVSKFIDEKLIPINCSNNVKFI